MTQIIDGKLIREDVTSSAMGGTELIATRMVQDIPQEVLQGVQIIHSRVRELLPDKKKILVLHDLPHDPEHKDLANPEYRKQFDSIICVSNWQMQMFNAFLGLPYGEAHVIQNGINPIEEHEKDYSGPIRLIYHTTPHRGLEILVPVFDFLSNHYNITLDVYSSFKIYGWEQRDERYKEVFDICKKHPKINYHGSVSNDEIREALKQSHIFAFPSIWQETSCLSVMEAISARNVAVHPYLAALPETTGGYGIMYQFNEDGNQHAHVFSKALEAAIQMIRDEPDYSRFFTETARNHIDAHHMWSVLTNRWIRHINSVKNN